jgi:Uma2 family endonuclease
MVLPQKAVAYIEVDEYLALENASQFKHEYLAGVIYAIQGDPTRGMAGGSQVHARIIRNASFALHGKLQGSPCEVLSNDMRLRISAADAVFYPDLLVHCGPSTNPLATTELSTARLVLEVLSPTTQAFDRGPKLKAYQQLAGLQTIILLSSMEEAGWVSSRSDDGGTWSDLQPWVRGTALGLPGLGVELGWAEVYAGVGLG